MTDSSTVSAGIELGSESGSERAYTRVGAVAVLVIAVGLIVAAGLRGVAAAAVVGIVWLLLRPLDAFAVGQVAVVVFARSGPSLDIGLGAVGIAVTEIGLFGLLLAPATHLSNPRNSVGLVVGWALAGGLLAWASTTSVLAPWLAGLVLLGFTGLAAYGLHRYQLVSLGLTEAVEQEVGQNEQDGVEREGSQNEQADREGGGTDEQ